MSKTFVTRFAPSPTGFLHLGHAYSALLAAGAANKNRGRFIVRIEDIDLGRCRREFEDAILEDLAWLGLKWETPVRRQSEHFADYRMAIRTLEGMAVIYPCFCTRREIAAEIERSAFAPHGPDGFLYPGTCRDLGHAERQAKLESGVAFALRLDTVKALAAVKAPLTFQEKGKEIAADPESLGDVVIARKDTPASYHLAVVWDDHFQGITHVIRGEDLFHATHIQRLLQALLGFAPPRYHHHDLLKGSDGKRFSKRHKALTLRDIRAGGKTASDLPAMIEACGGDISKLPF